MFVTRELAHRLEVAEALDGVACAEACTLIDPDSGGAVQPVAGGFCIFCGAASPLTHALAVGLHAPVSKQDVLEIEDFFRSRGAPIVVDVSPFADSTLRELLSGRGYAVAEMSNVLVREVAATPELEEPSIAVREAGPQESDAFCRAVVGGFFSREELSEEERRLGCTLFQAPLAAALLAYLHGKLAGGCGFSVRNRVASFYADAVMPPYRRRGVHRAMIVERLRRAVEAGCELATAGTQPGSTSQRNYQRLGFDVAYTKITMTKE